MFDWLRRPKQTREQRYYAVLFWVIPDGHIAAPPRKGIAYAYSETHFFITEKDFLTGEWKSHEVPFDKVVFVSEAYPRYDHRGEIVNFLVDRNQKAAA